MLPVGLLMEEHRLIERMIGLAAGEAKRILSGEQVDADFIRAAVDFIRTYADKCHHGKEESILFRDAAKKSLTPELKALLNELLSDHTYGRTTTSALSAANERCANGDAKARDEIAAHLNALAVFYPKHIEKEDKHFFFQSMEFFDKKEQDDMLAEFLKYDQGLIHEIYGKIVKKFEEATK